MMNERAEFERWYTRQYHTGDRPSGDSRDYSVPKDGRGRYLWLRAAVAWRAWRARSELGSKSRWISVKDQLPDPETTVLVCNERGEIFSSWASDITVFWFYGEEEDNRITNWQPLPAPPTTNPAA